MSFQHFLRIDNNRIQWKSLNGVFTVALGDYIVKSPTEYWIYGHSHRNINKKIGTTLCISNQLGYTFHNEHKDFNHRNIIDI